MTTETFIERFQETGHLMIELLTMLHADGPDATPWASWYPDSIADRLAEMSNEDLRWTLAATATSFYAVMSMAHVDIDEWLQVYPLSLHDGSLEATYPELTTMPWAPRPWYVVQTRKARYVSYTSSPDLYAYRVLVDGRVVEYSGAAYSSVEAAVAAADHVMQTRASTPLSDQGWVTYNPLGDDDD